MYEAVFIDNIGKRLPDPI